MSVLAALSVLVGLVMLASRNGLLHVGYASPALSPSANLTDYGYTTTVLLEAVATAFFIYLVWVVLAGPKRVPPGDRGLLVGTLFLIAFTGALLALVRVFAHRGRGGGLAFHLPLQRSPQTQASITPLQSRAPTATPTFRWGEFLLVGAIAAAIATASVVAYIVRRRRVVPAPRKYPGAGATELEAALDRGVDDLRSEPDVRRAVIAAYARMERALATHRLPREHWETPFEYLGRVLVSVNASRASIERLTGLFEWAKFSAHTPDEPMRREAIAALEVVRAELFGAR